MNRQTKIMTATGMFCTLAYTATAVGRIPLVLFLKYDPKDIVIVISGLIFGPLTAFMVTLTVSLIELFTISENGILGFRMNVISSCSFACTASLIYKRKPTLSGIRTGLFCGWGCMVTTMLLWNYIIAPIYMGCSREAVAELLLPVFLPFNLIKGGLNTAITMFLYKPAVTALRYARLFDPESAVRPKKGTGFLFGSILIIVTCILWLLSFQSWS